MKAFTLLGAAALFFSPALAQEDLGYATILPFPVVSKQAIKLRKTQLNNRSSPLVRLPERLPALLRSLLPHGPAEFRVPPAFSLRVRGQLLPRAEFHLLLALRSLLSSADTPVRSAPSSSRRLCKVWIIAERVSLVDR